MKALPSQDEAAVDGAGVCESLLVLLDMDKQQQQFDTTTANTLPIVIPSTNTKI